MTRSIPLLILFLIFAILGVQQSGAQIKVSLKIDRTKAPLGREAVFCDANFNCGLSEQDNYRSGTVGKDNILVEVSRSGNDFLLVVDTDGDNSLAGEKKFAIKNGSSIKINIRKSLEPGKTVLLPFEISHERETDGRTIDAFWARAHYLAVGTLNYGKCSVPVALEDMNRDGRIGPDDAKGGTNLRLDLNKDGKFWGKDEFRVSTEILEICGEHFLVSKFDHSMLEITPTDLRLAKTGAAVPDFSITLLNGTSTAAAALKGKSYVLDFWASWCRPCVANLPQIKALKAKYGDKLSIYSINVDEAAARDAAEKIISEYELRDLSAIRGMGDADPLWKTFGGANGNRLVIPLYALIDADGTVRYTGNGGTNLAELSQQIDKLGLQ